ncbi:MAG: sodium:solute symporter [Planctomycetes bacterium]|nr:sodium:solute symporter [Planctomycetota bacterium]
MKLPLVDLIVLLVYLAGVVALGCWFVRKSRTSEQFMKAAGSLPGWAVGLSIFGTFLSSMTFLGVPGKAYGGNWNALVFSFSLPIAALIAVRVFVPFYRRSGEISAYHHLEARFGPWARSFAVICYLLTQIARAGAILYLVSLALSALTGWDTATIIIVTGVVVTLYTLLGGIEAVIWTDVAQSLVLLAGAVMVTVLLLLGMPEGPSQALRIAADADKFSLGGFGIDFTKPTFWVVLLFGLFINLKNFGIDQNYVQRYHAARSEAEAVRSVWLGALLYVPVSLLFFFIGSLLFSYYQVHPEMLREVNRQAAERKLADVKGEIPPHEYRQRLEATIAELKPADVGDQVFPHFIRSKLPQGVAGLLIAAIFAAAMSSIDTSLNSSATVILSDFYQRYVDPEPDERRRMLVLYTTTLSVGVLGTSGALALIGVDSILDTWWQLEGIFTGGMLGLFLLGLIARRAGSPAAAIGVTIGLLVIVWMTFYRTIENLPESEQWLRNPLHANMTVVVGTLTIFLVGLIVSRLFPSGHEKGDILL